MSIRVYCPGGHTIRVKDKYAGLTGRCPRCGGKVQVPARISDDDIFSVLHEDGGDESSSDCSDSQLQAHLESSGISLVGSKVFGGPIKRCPKCHTKVHVPDNKVCPNCAGIFTHW